MSEDIQKAQELVNSFLKGKHVHDVFAKQIREQFRINGEPMDHWKDHFHIDIPYDNLNPAICRELDLKLLRLNQEAALFYAIANATAETMSQSNKSLYRDRFNAIVQEYKSKNEKLPASTTLDTMANADNAEVDSANAQFEIERSFWKDILDDLASVRKILENVTWNNKNDLDVKYAKDFGGS